MTLKFTEIFKEFPASNKNDGEKCKGRMYRCSTNTYLNSKGAYVEIVRMNPLKRMSCKGCEKCGWMDEWLFEDTVNLYHDESLLPKEPVHGALYRYDVISTSTDWETGYTELDEVGFVLMEV